MYFPCCVVLYMQSGCPMYKVHSVRAGPSLLALEPNTLIPSSPENQVKFDEQSPASCYLITILSILSLSCLSYHYL